MAKGVATLKVVHGVILPNLVFVSLHVGLVHLHRVKLNATHVTHQGVGCRQERVGEVGNERNDQIMAYNHLLIKIIFVYLVGRCLRAPSAAPVWPDSSGVCARCSAAEPFGDC